MSTLLQHNQTVFRKCCSL